MLLGEAGIRDRLGIAAVRRQIVGKGIGCCRVAPLRGEQQATGIEVAEQRQEAQPLVRAALVHHTCSTSVQPKRVALEVACPDVAAPGRAPAVLPRNRRNRTYAFGALKPILVGCLLVVAGCLRRLPTALAAIAAACVRIQPGRTYPRNPKIKPHTFLAYKLTC